MARTRKQRVAAAVGDFLLLWLATFTVNEILRSMGYRAYKQWEADYWRGWAKVMGGVRRGG